jgi:hypothetical protein
LSVLNLTNDGLYTVLIVLVRALVRLGPLPRGDLLVACGSSLEAVDPKQLNQTLTRWTQLGLFATEGDQVTLVPAHAAALGKTPDQAEARLPKIARTLVLSADNNARFWEAEASKAADLSRGLSWLLAQDVYAINTSNHDAVAALEIEQLTAARCVFQNDTRWTGIRAWMPYLGFARDGARMTVDPTVAVRDALPEVFDTGPTLTAVQFVDGLAQVLPVLDRGRYRTDVEAVLSPARWRKPPEGQVSTALSRALQRLEFEGLIALGRGSDAKEGITLTGVNGRKWLEVTTVAQLKPKSRKQ